MLSPDPAMRPSMDQVLMHPWLQQQQKFNWKQFYLAVNEDELFEKLESPMDLDDEELKSTGPETLEEVDMEITSV
jgi:hypothetical protein